MRTRRQSQQSEQQAESPTMIGEHAEETPALEIETDPVQEDHGATNAPPREDAALDTVLRGFREQQQDVFAELRCNEQEMQKQLEDSLCKGLDGFTKIRYGSQARKYLEDTEQVRAEMKVEVSEIMKTAVEDISQNFLQIMSTQKNEAAAFHEENMKQAYEIWSVELAQTLNQNHEKFVSALGESNDRMMSNFSDTIQRLAASMAELGETVTITQRNLSQSMTSSMETMSNAITGMIKELRPQVNDVKPKVQVIDVSHEDTPKPSAKLTGKIKSEKLQVKKPRKQTCFTDSSSEEDEEEVIIIDSDSDDEASCFKTSTSANGSFKKSNIPPFNDKEPWQVWFTRFKEIAKRQHWTEEQKLDVLLPKLQGEAGRFVYEQLDSKTRNNYKRLKRELTNRFRKVENPKTYGTLFSSHKQKATESVETYAAELKTLYDKAHSHRDAKTREEDLLRKFLDGLQDSKASFHVEFVKDPKNIDEAVDEVINFQEVRRKQGKSAKKINMVDYSSDDSDMEYQVARAPGRPPKSQPMKSPETKETEKAADDKSDNMLTKVITQLSDKLDKLTEDKMVSSQPQPMQSDPRAPRQAKAPYQGVGSNQRKPMNQHDSAWQSSNKPMTNQFPREPPTCFKCHQPGHYMRDCQMRMDVRMSSGPPTHNTWGRQETSGQPGANTSRPNSNSSMQGNH